MSPLEGPPSKALFVMGMHESRLDLLVEPLRHLGLSPVIEPEKGVGVAGSRDRLSRYNEELLKQLGSTWDNPAFLPKIELWDRLQDRLAEAREVFQRYWSTSGGDPDAQAWAWVDHRLTILAPFWIRALGLSPSVLLVHRHPGQVVRALKRTTGVPVERGLTLWDQYNRMALNVLQQHSGLVVGVEAFENDVKSGMRALQQHLEGLGVVTSADQGALAIGAIEGRSVPTGDSPTLELPNKIVVLQQVLKQADFAETVNADEMVGELAKYYDEDYYAFYGNEGDSPYRQGEVQWTSFFSMVAERIADDLNPRSVLDAGCAIGFLVEALRNRGVEAWGVDVSEWAISQVVDSVKPYCSVASLNDELDGQFDLITIIEVIEHMPEAVACDVVANLARHAQSVLFSSTADGFEEPTHINVHTPDHWARLFAANGFYRDFDYDAGYLSGDAVLFRRSSVETETLVVGYEQSLWRTRRRLQRLLDEIVLERDKLVTAIGETAQRAGLLDIETQELRSQAEGLRASVAAIDRRRAAEVGAMHTDLLRRDTIIDQLHQDVRRSGDEASAALAQVAAIETTKLFRYSAGLRRVYARLR